MTHSIMEQNKKNKRFKLWAVLPWLLLWQATALIIDSQIIIVSPVAVVVRLSELFLESEFYLTIALSLLRIVSGFLIGLFSAIVLAVLAAKFWIVRDLAEPFMLTVKSIPVASFVVLALIWFSSESLAIFIGFLMVLPIIYTSVLEGIENTDKKLLEMARVYSLKPLLKVRYIYFFEVYPFFLSGLRVALGLCWKAGIAAEVIGIPNNSIGEQIFRSKSYLDTASLFAWTVVVVAVSVIFERLVISGVKAIHKRLRRG